MDPNLREIIFGRLREFGIHARPRRGRPPRLGPGEELWLLGEGTQLTEVLATPLQAGRSAPRPPVEPEVTRLWVAEHIPPAVAQRLIAGGRAFVDGAGNAHLRFPGMVVSVAGNGSVRRAATGTAEPTPREWRGPALRALFHLLCDPTFAEQPLTNIATALGIAPGTIVQLFRDLEGTGNLVRLGRRKRRFAPDRELLDRWTVEYGRKLRPRLLLGRFEPADRDGWRHFDPTEHGALWGGERAAELLGVGLQPAVWTLYAKRPLARLLRAAKLRPDAEGPVELRHAFWDGALPAPRPDVTPPLLIQADLLATRDGRCRAAAQALRSKYLDRLVGQG